MDHELHDILPVLWTLISVGFGIGQKNCSGCYNNFIHRKQYTKERKIVGVGGAAYLYGLDVFRL